MSTSIESRSDFIASIDCISPGLHIPQSAINHAYISSGGGDVQLMRLVQEKDRHLLRRPLLRRAPAPALAPGLLLGYGRGGVGGAPAEPLEPARLALLLLLLLRDGARGGGLAGGAVAVARRGGPGVVRGRAGFEFAVFQEGALAGEKSVSGGCRRCARDGGWGWVWVWVPGRAP